MQRSRFESKKTGCRVPSDYILDCHIDCVQFDLEARPNVAPSRAPIKGIDKPAWGVVGAGYTVGSVMANGRWGNGGGEVERLEKGR